jgi:hypothetical protein
MIAVSMTRTNIAADIRIASFVLPFEGAASFVVTSGELKSLSPFAETPEMNERSGPAEMP